MIGRDTLVAGCGTAEDEDADDSFVDDVGSVDVKGVGMEAGLEIAGETLAGFGATA